MMKFITETTTKKQYNRKTSFHFLFSNNYFSFSEQRNNRSMKKTQTTPSLNTESSSKKQCG